MKVEQGPIRPPSEARSLLVRVTRNCPWNRCSFCPVYKGTRFELRTRDEIEQDIDALGAIAAEIVRRAGGGPIGEGARDLDPRDPAVQQVARFVAAGGRTAFLQDANSLLLPPDDLEPVLRRLHAVFPTVSRVTSYARSHTLCRRSAADLRRLREAGLDRVHVGLESGSDRVLALVDKGVTAARHVEAGLRAKEAGFELCCYVMPGLGGLAWSEDHASETARVLRAIDPHFVRLRTLAVPPGSPLAEQQARGEIEPLDDVEVARELRTLLTGFEGMTSAIRSDHVLNLLPEVEGQLPADLPHMLAVVDAFLALPPSEQDLFIVGRRLGIVGRVSDLEIPAARAHAEMVLARVRASTPGPLSATIRGIMTRFV